MTMFVTMVQKHPIVLSLFFFMFLLFVYLLPTGFIIFIYSSPLLACVAVYTQFYLPSKRKKILKDEREDEAVSSTVSKIQKADNAVSRNDASISQSQTLSQRNFKGKSKELDEKAAKGEMDVNSSTSPNVDSSGKSFLIEEKPRGPSDKSDSFGCNVSIGDGIARSSKEEGAKKSKGGGGGEAELASSSSEKEGERTHETKNKAAEWTKDDQKNLMDLGISELERNNRLESLIARRRARKLCKMNTEKIITHGSGVQISVAPVFAARGNPYGAPNESEENVPGSAPSVLLPTRNPFDLPYDPLEEKPDLTADSFQEEFMAVHQKFCRHESFILGPSPSLADEPNYPVTISVNWRFKREQEKRDHGRLDDQSQNQTMPRSLSITDLVTEEGESSKQVDNQPEENGEADNGTKKEDKMKGNAHGSDSSLDKGSEIGTETYGVKDNKRQSGLSSDDNGPTTKARRTPVVPKIQPPVFVFPDMVHNPSPNSDPCPLPKARVVNDINYLASPATIDRSSLDNHLLYMNNRPWHTPNGSTASDMQVEVSETGSPPLTGEECGSSDGEDSLTYDGDVEKEITSGSDEMWGVSPHVQIGQQHDLTSRKGNDFIREDITEGASGLHTELEAPLGSSSGPKISQDDKPYSNNSYNRISNDAEQQDENLHRPHESLNPSGKTAEEMVISDGSDESYPESGKSPESLYDTPPADLSFLIPTQDDKVGQNTRGIEIFGLNQSLYHPSTSSLQPEMAVQQDSITSSSPKSVLADRIPLAEAPSDLSEGMQMNIADYDMKEKIARDELLDEQLPESSGLTLNHDAQHVTEDLTNNPSISKPEKSEGASISNDAAVDFSKPPEKISGNLVECEARNVGPNPKKEPEASAATVTEEESANLSQEFKQDVEGNPRARDLTDNNKMPESLDPGNSGRTCVDQWLDSYQKIIFFNHENVLMQQYRDSKEAGARQIIPSSEARSEADIDSEYELEQPDRKQHKLGQSYSIEEDLRSSSFPFSFIL